MMRPLFLALGLLSLAAEADAKPRPLRHEDGFSVHVPKGWKRTATVRSEDGAVRTTLLHRASGATVGITCRRRDVESAKTALEREAAAAPWNPGTTQYPVAGDDDDAAFTAKTPPPDASTMRQTWNIVGRKIRMPKSRAASLTFLGAWPAKADAKFSRDFRDIVAKTRLR